ncbi:MAG: hypothetical protein RMI94_08095 [Bryobacterales bacterium]|nr:hypothetical protein [Bryobacteraceae bacterium]MDW8130496.1 hypothetical protein [Bryobacterales bacterium]
MAIELNRTSRANPAAEFLAKLPAARQPQACSFEQHLAGALTEPTSPQAQVHRAESGCASRQADWRQILDAPAAAEARPDASPQEPLSQTRAADPVATLKQALLRAGMNPEAFSFTEIREVVGYPGGSYLNHQVLFEAGATREYYDVALMLRNPEITVIEIRRLLGLGAAPVAG